MLHLVGFGLLFWASKSNPVILGIGIIAYTLGLRHAFDADHIAAIDNTVRKLIHQNQNPVGVGFYFSLGHSSVVFLMTGVLTLSVHWAQHHLPLFEQVGGVIGAFVSGSFLIVIALVNLLILIDLQKIFKRMKTNKFDPQELENLLHSRGFLSRIFNPLFKFINKSWQVLPIGFLFGLGFDTATEVSLLALSLETSKLQMPFITIMGLPILFAAGMNLMDTTDSVMMTGAYRWAFDTPLKKVYYNLTITSASVAAALLIGIVELGQVIEQTFNFNGRFWNWVQQIDLYWMGYALIILFIGFWTLSYFIWKYLHIAQRWNGDSY
ncbi:MAG: HoxN/HupN/NixA family nickel/cobalt transporter [Sporolactobacillus sp.]